MAINSKWLKAMPLALGLAAILAAPAPFSRASANVFHRDDRVRISPKMGDQLAKIGHLTNSIDRGRGTAFLVGRCHILTNYHVAFSNESAPDLNETSHFVLGHAAPIIARPVVHGAYDPASLLSSDEDWALLKLEKCAGAQYGWLNLKGLSHERVADPNLQMSSAGFPSDHDLSQINLDPSCRIYPDFLKGSREWAHDCATHEGNSGSPVFFLDSSGHPQVVAIVSSNRGGLAEIIASWSLTWGNGAVPVERFIDRIKPHLDADFSSGPKSSSLGKSH